MALLKFCLLKITVACLVKFLITSGETVFFKSPYSARIAENYTFTFIFSINATSATSLEPTCGIVNGDARANCAQKDAATIYSLSSIPGTNYSVLLLGPRRQINLDVRGQQFFELSVTIKPPQSSNFLQTTPANVLPPGAQIFTAPTPPPRSPQPVYPNSQFTINVFCCMASDVDKTINTTTITLKPITLVPANWSSDSLRGSFRRYPSPAHVERSTCQCDLYEGYCDNLCCCDEHCSPSEKDVFGCNGNFSTSLVDSPNPIPNPPFDCSQLMTGDQLVYPQAALFSPFPHAWFCLMYRNSAYLGLHFNDLDYDSISDLSYINKNGKERPAPSVYTWQDFYSKGYRQGIPLLTALPSTSPGQLPPQSSSIPAGLYTPRAAMFFPGKGPDGRCLRHAPIRFLSQDDAVSCSFKLESRPQCGVDTELSQTKYIPVPGTLISQKDSLGNLQMLSQPMTCACQQIHTSPQALASSCIFMNDTFCQPKTPASIPGTSGIKCSCQSSDIASPKSVEVEGKDNDMSWYCTNVVRAVDLTIGWANSTLDWSKSNISVTLVDITTPGERIDQRFSVRFVKPSQPPPSGYAQAFEPWRWYRAGDSVKYMPMPASGRSCDCLKPLPIKFGTNMLSACQFTLKADDFNDCDNLRGMAIAALRKLIPAERIAKVAVPAFPIDNFIGGGPQRNPASDWVSVVKLRRFPASFPNCDATNSQAGLNMQNDDILARFGRYPTFYRMLDRVSLKAFASWNGSSENYSPVTFCGQQVSRLNASNLWSPNVTNRTVEVVWPALCGVKRICERMPSSILISIFHTVSGSKNGTLQNEIIGATLSFSVRDWLYDASKTIHNTYFTAKVKFISVDSTPDKPSFLERLVAMADHWDILYPITGSENDKVRSVAAAAGLGLLLIGALMLAPPR